MSNVINKVALLKLRDKKVLMARSRGKDLWFFPGGKPETGESEEETLIRELREELSVEVVEGSPRRYKTFEAPAHGKPGMTLRTTYYFADIVGEPRPTSEIEEVGTVGYGEGLISDMGRLVFEDLHQEGLI